MGAERGGDRGYGRGARCGRGRTDEQGVVDPELAAVIRCDEVSVDLAVARLDLAPPPQRDVLGREVLGQLLCVLERRDVVAFQLENVVDRATVGEGCVIFTARIGVERSTSAQWRDATYFALVNHDKEYD